MPRGPENLCCTFLRLPASHRQSACLCTSASSLLAQIRPTPYFQHFLQQSVSFSLHRSNVVSKRKRGNILDRPGCQYLSYRVREFQSDRHSVAKNARVVIEFGKGEDV